MCNDHDMLVLRQSYRTHVKPLFDHTKLC